MGIASTWRQYESRLQSVFARAHLRVAAAFWLFGLVNNILYVIILSAALDLVGPAVPKATVLLADVVPSFLTKLTAPYYIHAVPYPVRILVFCALSAGGMLLIALTPETTHGGSVAVKMAGVVLASLSSGGGELSFLGLTHFYGPFSLAAWGSGTGGAGLLGAGAYAVATTTLGLSVKSTLLASALLPAIMLLSFFALLPMGPLKAAPQEALQYQSVPSDEAEQPPYDAEADGQPDDTPLSPAYTKASTLQDATARFKQNLTRARGLVIPYMLPLFLVYVAEYTINQGVAPTLLFPLAQTPFAHYRAFYPAYNALYQAGVFLSRSSLPFLRIRPLYTPALLQIANLALLTAHALSPFLPSVWFVFALVFWEGLLGGLVYVSTFAAIRDEVAAAEREFSLGAATVSDSAGICVAGLLGLALEPALCAWQVARGRDWCRRL